MDISGGPGGPMGMGPAPVTIEQTKPVICKCGNFTFINAVFLREVSALVSPHGKAGLMPVPTVVCNACGAVPDQIIPQFLKDEFDGKVTPASPAVSPETTPGFTKSKLTLL
jgi:hypothetical protein